MKTSKGLLCAAAAAALALGAWATSSARAAVMINEVDYDQPSFDTAEFIELAGNAGTNLSGWSLELVNGATDTVYSTIALPNFTIPNDTGDGWGFFVLGRPSVANNDMDLGADGSVQNGAPDGIRLLSPSSTVVQYMTYEGTMTGSTDDVPAGTSDDGVAVDGGLSKIGTGMAPGDFTWAAQTITPGAINTGQTLVPEPASAGAVLTVGLGALLRRRRRDRRRRD